MSGKEEMAAGSTHASELERAMSGRVTGVIIPPPDIRAVVDKTALFVAKNGKSFEEKILNSAEGKTAKFNFMRQQDPYHAYYEHRIREIEEGRTNTIAATAPTNAPPQPVKDASHESVERKTVTTTVKASLLHPIARIIQAKKESGGAFKPPTPFEFSLGHPSGLLPVDSDVIKLTAQYTAVSGRDFLGALAQREQRNPQFDFLKPTHMLFSYFTALVDAYSKILRPDESLKAAVSEAQERSRVLERAVLRWEYTRSEEERKRRESIEADAERAAFLSIDWHDFVVVETISFPKGEKFAAPPSMPAPPLETRLPHEVFAPRPQMMPLPPPPPSFSLSSRPNATAAAPSSGDASYDPQDDIRVVSDYQARVGIKTRGATTLVDPISGLELAEGDLAEHMRVQLLDPRWRQEQQRFLEKQQDTGYAAGGSIADNLRQFAKRRGAESGGSGGGGPMEGGKESSEGRGEDKRPRTDNGMEESDQREEELSSSLPPPPTLAPPPPAFTSNVGGMAGGYVPAAPPAHVGAPPGSAIIPPRPPFPMTAPPIPAYLPVPPLPPMPTGNPPLPPFMGAPFLPPAPLIAPFPPPFLPPTMMPPFPPMASDSLNNASSSASTLVPENDFAARFPNPITVQVVTPVDATWQLEGQSVDVQGISVRATGKELKEKLSSLLNGMPVNKQQVRRKDQPDLGFLKDNQTLASLNIGDGTVLELSVRSRGGKK